MEESTSMPTSKPTHEVELRLLFKHLLVYLIIIGCLRFLNMIFIPFVSWSSAVLVVWTIVLALHLLLFFLSTGVLGQDYEGKPVREIFNELLKLVKERNKSFRDSLFGKKTIPNDPVN